MKAKYKGLWTLDQFCQALFEDRELFYRQHGITHLRSITLLFTASDHRGEEVTVFHETGETIDGYVRSVPYNCAADFYDSVIYDPEPKTVTRASPFGSAPLSPL